MKNTLLLSAILIITVLACKKEAHTVAPAINTQQSGSPLPAGFLQSMMRYSGSNYSQPISKDTANRMIQSYLTSIDYPTNGTRLRSLSFDADTLRAYLNDSRIVTLKFVMAHPQSYMNSGNFGTNGGLNANALTFVIVGLDANDNYIYNTRNMVYDHALPCPTYCSDNYSALLN